MQVDLDREYLLIHPLVKELLSYKWKRVGIPGLIAYFSCYMIFLIFLTAFALVIPRPGPSSRFCSTKGNFSKHSTRFYYNIITHYNISTRSSSVHEQHDYWPYR